MVKYIVYRKSQSSIAPKQHEEQSPFDPEGFSRRGGLSECLSTYINKKSVTKRTKKSVEKAKKNRLCKVCKFNYYVKNQITEECEKCHIK